MYLVATHRLYMSTDRAPVGGYPMRSSNVQFRVGIALMLLAVFLIGNAVMLAPLAYVNNTARTNQSIANR